MEIDDEPEPPTGWQWLGGCCIGAVLGAIGAPLALVIFIWLTAYLQASSDAEGPSFLILLLLVPLGAIVGALGFPIARLIYVLLRAKVNRRRQKRR